MKLLFDFFPIVIFFVTYKYYGIYNATAALLIGIVLQLAYGWFKNGKLERMHIISGGLAVFFGSLTLIFKNPEFIMWKPTVLYGVFAAVLLIGSLIMQQPLIKKMLGKQLTLPDSIWNKLTVAWIGFFIFCAVSNIYVAKNFPEADWVNFKLFGLMGLTFAFVFIQAIALHKYLPKEADTEDTP